MSMRGAFFAAGILAAAATAAPAIACDASFRGGPSSVSVDYRPFSHRGTITHVTAELRVDDHHGCVYVISALSGGGSDRELISASGDVLTYRLFSGGDLVANADGVGGGALVHGHRENVTSRLRAVLAPGEAPPPGLYTDTIQLSVFNARTGARLDGPRTVSLNVNVTPRADATLAGVAGRFGTGRTYDNMDFGAFETGESRSAFLQVRSNAQVKITLESANSGVMRHVDQPSLPPVPYIMELDGDVVTFGAPLVRTPAPGRGGQSYEVRATIGDVSQLFAGRYRDTVTISVTPY
ncbi:MAG: hypothetical protein PVI23_16110 [Maricaulaceae bacterium]|jgi:hypothetical protein